MAVLASKVLAGLFTTLLSLFFGFLPLCLTSVLASSFRSDSSKQHFWLSFLLYFGGGVLIGNTLCHWLPEFRAGLVKCWDVSDFPLAELIVCSGFFFVCFLEVIIRRCCRDKNSECEDGAATRANNDAVSVNSMTLSMYAQEGALGEYRSSYQSIASDASKEINAPLYNHAEEVKERLAIVRTLFMVSALSFHSVIEGLALSLEQEVVGVWMNFAALALHKFVIAFAIGVELVASWISIVHYSASVVIFSLAPAIGAVFGIFLTSSRSRSQFDDCIIQTLQGLATGTVLYVVFFEVFPRGNELASYGVKNVIGMSLGFMLFLPSLLFHAPGA